MFLVTWHMVLSTVMTQILSRTTSLLPAVLEVRCKDIPLPFDLTLISEKSDNNCCPDPIIPGILVLRCKFSAVQQSLHLSVGVLYTGS